MGKSRQSGTSGASKAIRDANQKTLESIKPLLKDYEDYAEAITEYCNENGINLINTSKNSFEFFGEGESLISFIDPDSGRQINIYKSFLKKHADSIKDEPHHIVEAIDEVRKTLKGLPENFGVHNTEINFVNEEGVLGYFWPRYRTSIQISPHIPIISSQPASQTGMRGTVVHELTHMEECYNHGYCGALREFSDLSSYPTMYASRDSAECISTTVEQVYTKTLRRDAIMKNGELVGSAFYKDKGYEGTPSELYDYWDNEWSEITTVARNLLKNGV